MPQSIGRPTAMTNQRDENQLCVMSGSESFGAVTSTWFFCRPAAFDFKTVAVSAVIRDSKMKNSLRCMEKKFGKAIQKKKEFQQMQTAEKL
jgi:hypothetical protein